jgi:thiosulfate/3-mercaptopyruvate sulfurtransferase
MIRLFAFGTLVAFLGTASAASAQAAAPPFVSTDWLQQHLSDPNVRIVTTGDRGRYQQGHIPGARFLDHMDTVDMSNGHRPFAPNRMAAVLEKIGVTDGAHVVIYGESPMTNGWMYTAIGSTGHAADVSFLDGNFELWKSQNRPVDTATPAPASGTLTVHPATDIVVDAKYVREHLDSPDVHILDVRTTSEWSNGHLPNATFVLWQDLLADQKMGTFKSPDDIKALFAKAGVKPGQQIVTYCAVGLRGSLMYFAARSVGLPARVYLGSWQDWSKDPANPIVK